MKSYLVHYAYVGTLQAYEDEDRTMVKDEASADQGNGGNNAESPNENQASKVTFPGLTQTDFGRNANLLTLERRMTEDVK